MLVANILITYSYFPGNLIDSIKTSRQAKTWDVFFHGPNAAFGKRLGGLVEKIGGTFHPYGVNRGVARSWNEGIHAAMQKKADLILLLNDDLFFYPGGFDAFVDFSAQAIAEDPTVGIVCVNGRETGGAANGTVRSQDFACCALTPAVIESVGYFDENFRIAYCEDVDYFRRLVLAGFRRALDERVLVEHMRSQTVRSNPAIAMEYESLFGLNRAYFARKWGGDLGDAVFARPFDRPAFDQHIAYEKRDAPYGPPFDRED